MKYNHPDKNKETLEFSDELLSKIANFKKAIDGKTKEVRFASQ